MKKTLTSTYSLVLLACLFASVFTVELSSVSVFQVENKTLPQVVSNSEEPVTSLTFLLVSDIHMQTDNLEKLKRYFNEEFKRPVHYVLLPGDFDNFNNSQPISESTSYVNTSNILSFLEFASAPMIYIPGNHDSPRFYKERANLNQQAFYAQNNAYVLVEGLQLVGLGGSVPGYTETNGNSTQVWEGYPYQSDEEFGIDLKNVIEKYCRDDIQTLLMTHDGPYISSTAVDTTVDPEVPIYGGSKALSKTLQSEKHNILLNLHGHVHNGTGRANIAGIRVVNPGALLQGDFGILELVREDTGKKWSVKEVDFINLDTY